MRKIFVFLFQRDSASFIFCAPQKMKTLNYYSIFSFFESMIILTNKQLQSFKPKDKEYVIADRDGLSIRIRTTGHMSWVFRYRYNAKAQKIILGAYNQTTLDSGISLKKARTIVSKYKSLLEEDNDPKQWIEEQLREKRQKKTVKEVIDEFIERVLIVKSYRCNGE